MRRLAGLILVAALLTGCHDHDEDKGPQGGKGKAHKAPELDPSSFVVMATLLTGSLLVIRGRRK